MQRLVSTRARGRVGPGRNRAPAEWHRDTVGRWRRDGKRIVRLCGVGRNDGKQSARPGIEDERERS
jgi:hypothetical protein